jgi:hypothetical protein
MVYDGPKNKLYVSMVSNDFLIEELQLMGDGIF